MATTQDQFTFRMDSETRARLEEIAKREDRSVAHVVRRSLRETVAENSLLKNGKSRQTRRAERVPT
jgi:predicted transcriptional regulator